VLTIHAPADIQAIEEAEALLRTMEPIETPRLILRPLSFEDVPDLLEYHSDPEVVRYIPWPARTHDDVVEVVQAYQRSRYCLADQGDSLVLGWALRADNKVIGQSNMSLLSSSNQTADVGWVTHPRFGRQGYAQEATQALLTWAFERFDLHRVVAHIDTRNVHSARFAEKLGMRREAELKKAIRNKGQWCDTWVYAVLREEVDCMPQKRFDRLD